MLMRVSITGMMWQTRIIFVSRLLPSVRLLLHCSSAFLRFLITRKLRILIDTNGSTTNLTNPSTTPSMVRSVVLPSTIPSTPYGSFSKSWRAAAAVKTRAISGNLGKWVADSEVSVNSDRER